MKNIKVDKATDDIRNKFVDKYIFERVSLKGIETVPLAHVEKAYPLSNYSDRPNYLQYGHDIPAYKLALYFIEIGAHNYCADIVKRMGERFPANREGDSLNVYRENLLMASYTLQFKATRIASDVWLESNDRKLLALMISESKAQFKRYSISGPNPLEGSSIGVALYNLGDYDLFESYCEDIEVNKIGSTLKKVKDLFAPMEKGLYDLQCSVISAYASNIKNINQSAVGDAVDFFWSDAGKHLGRLGEIQDKKLIRAIIDGAKSINITAIGNTRQFILSRKAFALMSGLLHLGAIARRSGVALDEEDYKSILAPLSDVGKISGTAWMQALDHETVSKAKENLNVLLDGFSPSNAPVGKISKGMANSLSVMTGDLTWMGKLRLAERGRALEDQLGI